MRYADSLLTTGETVVVRSRQHWLALLLDSKNALALWILAVVAFAGYLLLGPQNQGLETILGYVALIALVLGLVLFLFQVWQWVNQDYLVTNRRILKVEGIINKHSADSSLEKINDAMLSQDLWGRMFNYGDLDILTAADTAIDRYRMLNAAPAFKREMLNQKHALEMEFSYRAPPSPPLRTAASEMPPEPAASAPQPAASSSQPVSGPPLATAEAPRAAPQAGGSTAEEVTQTLSRLADLRDRGAITPEEYQAKKAELLGRL
ncbi:MAG: PH domain-containing protein [Chloroflexi bacterium]|nr:PH domain-containing protein [Chloroflexota bacterium]